MTSRKKIKRYLETNENEETAIQNLWDTGKAILTRIFIHSIAGLLKKKKKKGRKKKERKKRKKL